MQNVISPAHAPNKVRKSSFEIRQAQSAEQLLNSAITTLGEMRKYNQKLSRSMSNLVVANNMGSRDGIQTLPSSQAEMPDCASSSQSAPSLLMPNEDASDIFDCGLESYQLS